MTIAKEKLIWMYRTMERHREFEEGVAEQFDEGHVPGFVHLSQGQEAIAAGAMAAINEDDYIITTHRGHGELLAKGGKPNEMMAELYGKKTGVMKGKGGSMHFADPSIGDIGADGILGTGPVMSCGVGLTSKLKKNGRVTVCFFGDGQTNTGRFHEALNLASAWKLPVVYLCENNTYGESTYIYDIVNITKLTDRALSYNIPSIEIDGNDVIAVYEAVTEAAARARKGEGPTFIEAKTCRWRGHYEGDTQTYRTEKEIADCKKKDPIVRFRKDLIARGVMTEAEADKIHKEAVEEIVQAVKFAEESPWPEPAEIYTDIY
ncbi:MAG: thiamine pyrophosphate-dependent dehydrogenase E1 component subunit alpha [Dehalococcoidales bacterium]|nr:thiamine pyrophosphate-dependent dehydrogenase E1 component subunit alpha [Dehalococcoidales bacterium]